ncbi:phage tail spike protein [Streptococcus anginosus]|uniref:phage tail spike protein n=1 Tax=Streptococcus anginosus TaxID=1328 RepID=UPI0022E2603A|nr:phage tail spike protein [Streptococcus anginosus]
MLYLLDENVRTVKWNGIPLHETSSAIVKEETNGDFYLTVRYPITDTGIYQLIKEDMLIKAPAPVLGAQLFRIKKPIENDDSLDITAYHVTDDIMQRSITPISVVGQGCAMALSQMVQNAKTGLGDFSFTSDITDNRTFNTTETETLYSVLMDGKHSIVGTWEGELVRDNFALSIKRSRGANRGVVITTHKNLNSYQRTKNSQGVVTRIHARSTFKPEGAEDDVTLTVTVDSPLINAYPYINEKEYENNNAKTVDDLKKWAEAKFKNDGIDKVSDAIEIEAYELDGQVVHLGDTVNLKSRKHNVDVYKKAIAYEYNALTEEYISITFDDKAGVGGSRVSSGLSSAADAILGASATAQNVAVERAVKNANQAFDAEFEKRVEAINDGIEQVKVKAAEYADRLNQAVTSKVQEVNQLVIANRAEQDKQYKETLAKASASSDLAKQAQNLATQVRDDLNKVKQTATQAQSQVNSQIDQVKKDVGAIRTQQTTYEQSNEQNLARITQQMTDKASKTEVKQTADGIREEISQISVGGRNLLKGSKGEFKPDRNPSNFDNWQVFYASEIYLEEGKQYIISGKTDGIFSNNHQSLTESDNVILWFLNKSWTVTQIVSGPDTGTTGTIFIWNKPTGTYHLRVNTYHKDARKKVWEVKVERGTIKTDWSPAPEDTDEQITAARAAFEKTAEGLKTDMTAVKSYVADDGKRREQLEQYTRTETARSTEALRKQVSESYVAKSQHTEDVRGIARRFEELVIGGNNLLAYANLNEGGYYQNALKQDPAYIYSNLIEIKSSNYYLQVWEIKAIEKKNWTGIQYFDESKKPLANGYSTFWFNGYFKQLLQVPAAAKYIAISLDKRALNKDEIKFKLELGSIPSDWSPAPEDTNTKLAEYKQGVDGRFATITSQLNNKANQTDFQKVQETTKLYERIIGSSESDVASKVSKMVMSNSLFQVEVSKNEGLKTVQAQLAGSWAVKNINSAGDLISGLNLGANGVNRLDGRLTHITGQTLIDNAVIKSAMIDKLKTANFESGSVTTQILASGAVTADKLVVDQAFFNKLTSNEAYLKQLFAKQAFIAQVQSVDLSATSIKTGVLNANLITAGNLDASKVKILNLDVKNLVGDVAKFVQTAWESQYSNLTINGEELSFGNETNRVGFTNRSPGGLFFSMFGYKAAISPNATGGINIRMATPGNFRLSYGTNSNFDAPLIEANRDEVKIGTENSYIRISNSRIRIVKNNSVVKEY